MGCSCASYQDTPASVSRHRGPPLGHVAGQGLSGIHSAHGLSGRGPRNHAVANTGHTSSAQGAGHVAAVVAPTAGGTTAGPSSAPSGGRRHGGGAISDTVNGFLAERRHGGSDAQVDVGPRFNAYARYLGIDHVSEQDLLWVARCALHAPLPEGWTQHFDDGFGRLFFHHQKTSCSSWTHPLEQEHREVHNHLRKARLSGTCEDAAEQAVRAQLEVLDRKVAAAVADWTEHQSESGHAFYFSRSAQRSSWNDPRAAVRYRLFLWRAALDTLEGRSPQDTLASMLPCFGQDVLYTPQEDYPPWLAELHREGSDEGSASRPNDWLSPRVLLAERAVECPVCYEPLYCSRPAVLKRVDNGRRLCGHYFCLRCAQRLGGNCPLCRARSPCGCTAVSMPNVEHAPRAWFRMVDNSANGRLERDEVVRALEAVLPLDAERLRRALGVTSDAFEVSGAGEPGDPEVDASGWWGQWNAESSGGRPESITEEAFCAEGGLLQWIVENLRELRRSEQRGRPPELTAENLQSWFEFWASEPQMGLSRAELLGALMRTLGVSGVERQKVREIRGTIEHCYHVWAPEGGERVTLEAFVKHPGGLGIQLLTALLPSLPEDAQPVSTPASPPLPLPAYVRAPVKPPPQEKPALWRSGSFQDLIVRLSRLRSATEIDPSLAVVTEDRSIDVQRV